MYLGNLVGERNRRPVVTLPQNALFFGGGSQNLGILPVHEKLFILLHRSGYVLLKFAIHGLQSR